MDEAALHDLLSGRRRDLSATLIRSGLHCASWFYSSAMRLRNLGYSHHWLSIHRSSVPVISLGNITTGGTGKTPMAAWLANWLVAAGYKPGLISRGYRSIDRGSSGRATDDEALSIDSPQFGNDEKLVLDRLCPGVPHLQRKDRVKSVSQAVSEYGCHALILDDGFQHRRLHRDLDLVLVDALQPWGYGHVLPRGLLREPLCGLRRADLIIMTRVNQCTEEQRLELRATLTQIRGNDECVEVAFVPNRLVDLNWQPYPLSFAAGKKAYAFCGIGNPDGFRQTVVSLGVNCETTQPFPDHHHYDETDLMEVVDRSREQSAEIVLTTQKDLVKIPALGWSDPPLFAIEIGVQFLRGRELLESQLRRVMAAR